jgi:hypothetical protein
MTTTVLLLTDSDTGECDVFVIPSGPFAAMAARQSGEEYEWPEAVDEAEEGEDQPEREGVNTDIEELFYHVMDPKNKEAYHNGNLTDSVLNLPREPVIVSHIFITNAPV